MVLFSKLSDDILHIIGNFLDAKTSCRIECTSQQHNLKILTYIKNVVNNQGLFLNDQIIQQDKFSKIILLKINNADKVTNINHLKTLQILDIS